MTWLAVAACGLLWQGSLSAATLPAGFSETVISEPPGVGWTDAAGLTFESNGRMYVWERSGRVWFKDTSDPAFSLLLDISEEVGAYNDLGFLGFALDPNFRVNGYIYLLYVVDRHHLLNFGTPSYNANANEYFAATIGRLTRYTCRSSDGFRSVDPASRIILIGETKQTGFPTCSDTHGVGSLVFGVDGTLLVSCGDGASAYGADLGGAWTGSYAPQALVDGILRPKEDIGSLRVQLVDCLNGKVLRIDPATGDGVPSNPYYDPASPRAPRSRAWALGLRNPCRMTLRPESGSHDPTEGNPGILYIGDVGWDTWECLKVVTSPRQNFGWPLYEGLGAVSYFYAGVLNRDAANPLYPASGCRQYFAFEDLLKEDTLEPAGQPPFNNPCNAAQKIPSAIPQFLHARPVLDWNQDSAITRTPIYGPSGQAQTANVGAGGSPVTGTQFRGNCAIGGTWYTGTNFPAQYQNRYYFADWGQGLIKTLTFDANDKPLALASFASVAGAVVNVVQHPTDGSLYYITYNDVVAVVRQISFVGNRTPVAVASADQYFGPSPLAVQLSSSGSSDPDGQTITYSWNFGDGSPISTVANPSHSFSALAGVPTKYVVTLTVTDSGGLSSQATLIVSVNNTPPNVTITSPVDGALYSPSNATIVNLTATVSDTESSDSQLFYQWQTFLHHNEHNHGNPVNTNHVTTTVISPTGCDGINIFYTRILLTVTDPAGLSTTREVRLYPDCGPNTPPVISAIANQSILQNGSTAAIPFTVGDGETAAANLQLSTGSSNPALAPLGNIVFGGSGSNRTVTLTPATNQTGSATITVTVNDGPNNTSTNFVVTVNPSVSVTKSFTNSATITIPDQGAGTTYPSTINVTGMTGTINNVTVTLRNLMHTWKADVDVLLVSLDGQKVLLMSDAGAITTGTNSVTITLSDAAAASLPASTAISSGTYKPTDYTDGSVGEDNFPSPAPAAPYGSTLSVFNSQPANGTWSLYVFDDGPGDLGSLAGGWSLTITTISATSQAPVITWTNPAPITYGTSLSGTQLNATASVPGTFVYNPAVGTVLKASNGQVLSATFTPTDTQNYTSTTNTVLMDVQKVPLTVTANSRSKTYGEAVIFAGTEFSAGGLLNGDTVSSVSLSSSGAAAAATVAGSPYNIVPSAATGSGLGNYTIGYSNGTLTVNATALLVAANDAGRPYGATNPDFTVSYTGFVNGQDSNVLGGALAITTPADTNSAVGTYPIIPSGLTSTNYTITFTNGTLNVGPTAFLVAANDASRAYGATNPDFTVSYTGFVNGQDSNVLGGALAITTPADTNSAVGTYPIIPGGLTSTNYTITFTNGTLTVYAVDLPPTISSITDQTIDEDTSTPALNFTVGDSETAPGSLALSGDSSNPTLVPTNNIVFGGSDSNRTVTVTPATNQNGTATITVTVSDGTNSTSDTFVLTVIAVPATNSVFQWDRFEAAVINTNIYADPFRDVTLNVLYTRPDASSVSFWGFHGGGNTWRIRFMPDQIGTWSYNASFSDGAPGATGSFQCITGNIPGMISADESNPIWFGFEGGNHVLIRSFHVGDRFFATNWPATNRTAFLDWAQSQGYNMLSIASHYLNRAVAGRGLEWDTPDLWDGATQSLRANEYQTLETMLDDLAARKMLVFPFAGFFGKSSDFPTNQMDQELYLRYTLARIGPYWNVVFNVAGPEPLYSTDTNQYQNAMGINDIARLGNLIESLDVFGHPLTVHNVTDQNAFLNQPWESYTSLQGPKTLNRQALSSGLLTNHSVKPLLAEEALWPGNTLGHPVYSDTDIRKNGFVIMMSAAALNFGDMSGDSSSGFSGSMDLNDKIQSRHDIIKQVWDYFETQRFYRMSPKPDLVNNGWCLAEPGREYLVYLQSTGNVTVTVSNGPFQGEWINAQNTMDKRPAFAITNGLNLASPVDSDDWLLHLYKPIEVWRAIFFPNELENPAISGNNADPDGDGVRNVGEFLYALNPIVADTQSGHLPALTDESGNLMLRFMRPQETGSTLWMFEFSSDLNNWSQGVPGIDYDDLAASPNGDGTETVSLRIIPTGTARFVRVKATLL